MRHVIVHYHIFKNAGSTFASTLRRNFGPLYAEFEGMQPDSQLGAADLLEYLHRHEHVLAVTSHHLRPPKPDPTESLTVHDVLLLREPIDRLRSMYDFYRTALPGEDQLTVKAKEMNLPSFLNFVLDTFPEIITNPQVNLIANRGSKIPDEDDLARAAAIVRNAAVPGTTEQFNLCCTVAERLRPFFPNLDLSYLPENVTRGRRKHLQTRQAEFERMCGPRLFNAVRDRNQLDASLHEVASTEMCKRFESLSLPEVCLQDFKKRVAKRMLRPLSPIPGLEHSGAFLAYISAADE